VIEFQLSHKTEYEKDGKLRIRRIPTWSAKFLKNAKGYINWGEKEGQHRESDPRRSGPTRGLWKGKAREQKKAVNSEQRVLIQKSVRAVTAGSQEGRCSTAKTGERTGAEYHGAEGKISFPLGEVKPVRIARPRTDSAALSDNPEGKLSPICALTHEKSGGRSSSGRKACESIQGKGQSQNEVKEVAEKSPSNKSGETKSSGSTNGWGIRKNLRKREEMARR